jgi:hypothetical protein
MYSAYPAFVLGFHGCDKDLAEKIFSGEERLKPSQNNYDWLGNGVYFWEQNPLRALEYAHHLKDNPQKGRARIEEPAVIGAVINNCIEPLCFASAGKIEKAPRNRGFFYDERCRFLPGQGGPGQFSGFSVMSLGEVFLNLRSRLKI